MFLAHKHVRQKGTNRCKTHPQNMHYISFSFHIQNANKDTTTQLKCISHWQKPTVNKLLRGKEPCAVCQAYQRVNV